MSHFSSSLSGFKKITLRILSKINRFVTEKKMRAEKKRNTLTKIDKWRCSTFPPLDSMYKKYFDCFQQNNNGFLSVKEKVLSLDTENENAFYVSFSQKENIFQTKINKRSATLYHELCDKNTPYKNSETLFPIERTISLLQFVTGQLLRI